MSEYLFRMELYEDSSRFAVLEKVSAALPYLRIGSSEEVQLIPPHPVFETLSAVIQSETITREHPYIALRLECALGRGAALKSHFLNHGWKRTTVKVTVVVE